jgi:hypothetical protein
MTTLCDPATVGFSHRLTIIDRCQVFLMRAIGLHFGAGRLILKGGMAMRAAVGGMRLTKDMDFDRAGTLSLSSLGTGLPTALTAATADAGIRMPSTSITKSTETTVRARLEGRAADGTEIRFEIEVSGREAFGDKCVKSELVVAPSTYGIAPFNVMCCTNDTLAFQKSGAVMSNSRDVPRDILDLHDLAALGGNPVPLLADRTGRAALESMREEVLRKIGAIGHDRMREELAPYLPVAVRDALTEDRWIGMTLHVAEAVEGWVAKAIEARAGPQTPS